jgi:DNA-binding MarR family transcriptional regulator
LIDALLCTAHLIDVTLERYLKPELNVPLLIALRTVERSAEPLSIADVADALGCSRTNATHLVTRLAVRDFLEVLSYANDPNRRDVRITPAGRDALERGNARLAASAAAISASLAATDAERFVADLERFRNAVRPPPAARGDAQRVLGKVDPSPWVDGYRERDGRRQKKVMMYGVEKDVWDRLTLEQRQAQQEADLHGRTMEDVLEERANPLAYIMKRLLSAGSGDSPSAPSPARDDPPLR